MLCLRSKLPDRPLLFLRYETFSLRLFSREICFMMNYKASSIAQTGLMELWYPVTSNFVL